MPSNFEWIFKRDPYAAERERLSGSVNQPPRLSTFPGLVATRSARVDALALGTEDRQRLDTKASASGHRPPNRSCICGKQEQQ